ncbi:MAG: ABC transporter ATP-binding protein [Chloroflexota bacterium]|nr:ABC transporter ATP-binding protein [Chloroflexota bacterium]
MSNVTVQVEELGKRYRIGQREQYKMLRDVLMDTVRTPIRRILSYYKHAVSYPPRDGDEDLDSHIWALKDVSFEVRHGEVTGIIGRNGAGKSTLLKILSRITKPTRGCARIRGRVGSLLEVGVGFHPELTGRENIYLNGAILGMDRPYIARKLDEIVEFSGVEQFLDTPVKRYSSGMYMRLAFAIAAHLEPEILIVDEVLAVGDAAFQKKCLGRMGSVAKEGRTVLFVSHNMVAVEDLCDRVIWLDRGRIVQEGKAGQVVSRYLQTSFSPLTEQVWKDTDMRPGNDQVRLRRACAHPVNGSPEDPITVRTPFMIEVEYENLEPNAFLNINIQLYNEQGILVFEAGPIHEPIWQPLPVGLFHDTCYIPGDLLNDGMYRVVLYAVADQGTLIHREDDILIVDVRDTPDGRGNWYGNWAGVVRPILDWRREFIEPYYTPTRNGSNG